MSTSNEKPKLHVASSLRAKFPAYFCIGLLLGIAHRLLWTKDHPVTLAQSVWSDQVAMTTMFCLAIPLMALGMALFPFRGRPFHHKIASKIQPELAALTTFASIAFSITAGFGLVAMFTCAASHAPLIILFLLYLVAMMEITMGLWHEQGLSKASPYLLSLLVVAPLIARIS
ncbi:hypothetical protein [Dyella sp. GSA-30]|uniref:hypothetical protein n=1 Tax=Dyella sp. GSA-30 TaxID=2994496 RepID=UPI002492D0F0|nr:hypothetical protein [Dyella sp. GSA-30]BDU22197.1 hypothetical protein DYGSA30_36540 [Dyella sp. GSA-30]